MSEDRVAALLAEALHDITPPEQDGGVPDVCNRFEEHARDAAALLATPAFARLIEQAVAAREAELQP